MTPDGWRAEATRLRVHPPRGLLFLCVANSARSQVAEGIARTRAPQGVAIWSAGSAPGTVHPLAIQVLAEIGIDARGQVSKGLEAIPAERVDTVITLCAEEVCPAWLGSAVRIHWSLPDPAAAPEDERLDAFRRVRDILVERLDTVFGGGR